ncbi:KGK domain-containing protein [Anabaena sp. CCY 9910]|uniref:KGK domain-containing protein n=1 Tax=Anabaena sp. CCY 9910 TaxID=3103870 RepID=UPI0039DF37F2
MEDRFKPAECNDNDVLEIGDYTYKISKFLEAFRQINRSDLAYGLQQQFNENGIVIQQQHSKIWFDEGLDCQILKIGSQGWKRGKVKFSISVDFYIEEEAEMDNNAHSEISGTQSPLDDLRRMMNEETS